MEPSPDFRMNSAYAQGSDEAIAAILRNVYAGLNGDLELPAIKISASDTCALAVIVAPLYPNDELTQQAVFELLEKLSAPENAASTREAINQIKRQLNIIQSTTPEFRKNEAQTNS
jgi:hypothetical protein